MLLEIFRNLLDAVPWWFIPLFGVIFLVKKNVKRVKELFLR